MKINEDIYHILDTLNQKGFEAYLVGGAVRNYLLGLKVNDYDITTNALPSDMISLFDKTILTGVDYGTVTVIINHQMYEVTTYRMDQEYLDNRRPSYVKFSKELEEDLIRRDFTINAICMDKNGAIVDPINGLEDIVKRIIRAIGNPETRFREDALRMIRAIRFMADLDFSIEKHTLDSIKANSEKIKYISTERIRIELNKILLSKVPSKGMFQLAQSGLLQYIIPELIPCIGFEQKSSYHDMDVFSHLMKVMDNTYPKVELRLAALFHDITKPACLSVDEKGEGHFYGHHITSADMSSEILRRLKYSNDVIQKVWRLIRYHPLKEMNIGEKGVKRFIENVGRENLNDIFNLNYADIIGKSHKEGIGRLRNMEQKTMEIVNRKDPLNLREMEIDGKALKRLGIKEGPIIGELLDRLLAIVLEYPSENTEEKLIAHARNILENEYKMKRPPQI
ncbi:MAG: CCA tRNA nucleotidyltransferase [Tissierellales bacterium]|nr:CCA tRNA nucleotidyltransferase [Tissierellales bacterium]MBN2827434.1 CCA tRNA nucleotidyltransferase [Tissierellales bacterium]